MCLLLALSFCILILPAYIFLSSLAVLSFKMSIHMPNMSVFDFNLVLSTLDIGLWPTDRVFL